MTIERTTSGVATLEKVLPSGWGLNMHLVSLPEGVLVHSPTWLGEDTFEHVDSVGTPRVLFAPNHFHHLSLARFRERYPKAIVVASDTARPGLRARKHDKVLPLSAARDHLPGGVELLEPPGTKAGEAFLSMPGETGRTWLVSDAFFGINRPVSGPMGIALRATGTVPGLCVGKTFRWLGLSDRRTYLGWLLAQLADETPTTLVMSHGEPVTAPDLSRRLAELAKRRLS